jgi:hypothetical protein
MHRSRPRGAGPIAGTLLVLALLLVAAACGSAGAAAPSPSQVPATPAPSGLPTSGPSAAPTDAPSEAPTEAPSEAPDGAIDLDTADGHDVSVVVIDDGGVLSGVASGRAGDGMSVRWGDVEVENLDEDTLRVTWAGLPVDAEVRLDVAAKGGGYVLAFTQPAPPENSDALGFDRVLVLDFEVPVDAGDVEATFSAAG